MRTEPRSQRWPVPQPEAMGTDRNTRNTFWTPGNISSLWWWPRAGKVAQGGCGSSSLDIFKSFLDMVLGTTRCCLSREVGHNGLQRSLQNQPSCESVNLSAHDLDGLPGFQKLSVWYNNLAMLLNNLPEWTELPITWNRIRNAESLSESVNLNSPLHFFFLLILNNSVTVFHILVVTMQIAWSSHLYKTLKIFATACFSQNSWEHYILFSLVFHHFCEISPLNTFHFPDYHL